MDRYENKVGGVEAILNLLMILVVFFAVGGVAHVIKTAANTQTARIAEFDVMIKQALEETGDPCGQRQILMVHPPTGLYRGSVLVVGGQRVPNQNTQSFSVGRAQIKVIYENMQKCDEESEE